MKFYIPLQVRLIGSLLTLLLVFAYIKFSQDPPKITNIFTGAKPGVLAINAPERVNINKSFKVSVEIDTAKQNVNVVGVYLKYDPQKLELLDLDTTQSFCQFYPEKKFDPNLGTISIACGSPHPGVSGKNTIIDLEFISKNVGVTNIITDPRSKILLSNGKGTNILSEYPTTPISILSTL